MRRREQISYTIEDLDAIEPAPLESAKTPTDSSPRTCSCDTVDVAGALETREQRGDLRKYRSEDSRWINSSFLSPDDAIWDLKKHASEGTEFRWVLHTSNTDLDLARKIKCSCHSLTPEEKKPQEPQRGDLRKHHSAETDKWSVRAENLLAPPMHDLRKHSSDNTRIAQEVKWTLQVPEVLPNPKPRCRCPKSKSLTPSPPVVSVEPEQPEVKEEKVVTLKEPEKRLYYSQSLTPEEPVVPAAGPAELKKHASENSRLPRQDRVKERPRLERSAQVKSIGPGLSKKWEPKEKVSSPEETKKARTKWAMKPHFSLPVEKKDKWHRGQDSVDGGKSKSLRERPKYSIRRSMSPEPDPRQLTKLEDRIIRRLISPEITITAAKFVPYENSPLPNVGIKKREPKHISEIKWTPYDGSPTDGSSFPSQEPPEDPPKSWSPFHNVTPTHHPPPKATPCKSDEEDDRWRFLNQVSPFPIYQGGWKDESPERTPPRISTPEDMSPSVWSPLIPTTPVGRRKSQHQPPMQQQMSVQSQLSVQQQLSVQHQLSIQHQLSVQQPSPLRKGLSKSRAFSRKRGLRARSESGHQEDRLAPPQVIIRASSEEPKSRQRPQLLRSKALLEVPVPMDMTKRSLSEEVPRMRARDHARGPNRARSEEVPKYEDPWFANNLTAAEATELRQYVTTV